MQEQRRGMTATRLDYTFDKEHTNPEKYEQNECGCSWWNCIHCEHKQIRTSCMACEDVFYDITT